MILSSESIADAIDDNRIVLDPPPTANQIQPASLDIRIGDTLLDPVTDNPLNTLTTEPGRRYHAYTRSRIGLPNDIAAFMTGRSTYGRKGVAMHVTAGWVDPGWDGQLLFEIVNLSKTRVPFKSGARVAQLVFFPLDQPSSGYSGQYQGQEAP